MDRGTLRQWLLPGPGALSALVVALPASISLLTSYDLFFNIAQGRFVLAHGFPDQDPFSITAHGSWFPHEWGYGVLAEWSVRLMGGAGPAVLSALVLAITILVIWRLLLGESGGRGGLVSLLLFALVLGSQSYTWVAQRAYLFGNLFFAVSLVFLQWARHDRPWAVWLFVPLGVLWANMHGSWLVGPVLLGAFACGTALDARAVDKRSLVPAVAAMAAFLAAAISPRGIHTCLYPLGFLAESSGGGIWEWNALDLGDGSARAFLGLVLVWVWLTGRFGRVFWSLSFPALGITVATLGAERHGPMAAMLVALACAAVAGTAPRDPRWEARKGRFFKVLARIEERVRAFCRNARGDIWPIAAVVVVGCLSWHAPASLDERMDRNVFPVESIRKLCEQEPGRVLNRYYLGGAISALCGPGFKVFIDGRNDLFGPEVHKGYDKLVQLEEGWSQTLESYDPDYLLWSRFNFGNALLDSLAKRGDWQPVVRESSGVLWIKKRP